MKTSKKCPKCANTKILFIPGKTGAYGTGNNIPVGATIFSTANVHRYVCCACGYSEEWVSTEDIPRLVNRYS